MFYLERLQTRLKYSFDPVYITIMFLVMGVILLIWGGAEYIATKQTADRCSSVTTGVVVNVEESTTYSRGKEKIAYVATIKPEDGSIFSDSELRSGETDFAYWKGENVVINYDPSNTSTYYIEHDEPDLSGTYTIIAGVVVLFLGLCFFGIGKKLKV